jgi:hypothetical protein
MLSAYVLFETEVGKVAHATQAITKLDGVQLAEDLVGVGRKQQPALEGGGLPLGGVAHRIAGAGTDRSSRPPFVTGRESCTSPAAEPALCDLLDDRNGPGAVWSPRPPPAASYSPKDRGSRSRRGTAGARPFQPVPARLECHSSLSVSPAPTRSAWSC